MKDLDLYYGDDEKPFKGFKFMWYINVFVLGGGVHMIYACEGSWCLKHYSDIYTRNGQAGAKSGGETTSTRKFQ